MPCGFGAVSCERQPVAHRLCVRPPRCASLLCLPRKENVQVAVTELKALKAQYLEATGEDWDVKTGAKKPSKKSSAASQAKGNQQARVEKMAAAEPAPEPAAEGDDAEDGVRTGRTREATRPLRLRLVIPGAAALTPAPVARAAR